MTKKEKSSKIKISEVDAGATTTLKLKNKKDDSRVYKLIAGKNYTREGSTLVKAKIVGDNKYVIITDNNGKKQKMNMGTFFDLCILMKHIGDLPNQNLIGETKVVTKESKDT